MSTTQTEPATATVRRYRAPSGNRDADYFSAECDACPWKSSGFHSNRTVEGRTLAERDAADHNAARHAAKTLTSIGTTTVANLRAGMTLLTFDQFTGETTGHLIERVRSYSWGDVLIVFVGNGDVMETALSLEPDTVVKIRLEQGREGHLMATAEGYPNHVKGARVRCADGFQSGRVGTVVKVNRRTIWVAMDRIPANAPDHTDRMIGSPKFFPLIEETA